MKWAAKRSATSLGFSDNLEKCHRKHWHVGCPQEMIGLFTFMLVASGTPQRKIVLSGCPSWKTRAWTCTCVSSLPAPTFRVGRAAVNNHSCLFLTAEKWADLILMFLNFIFLNFFIIPFVPNFLKVGAHWLITWHKFQVYIITWCLCTLLHAYPLKSSCPPLPCVFIWPPLPVLPSPKPLSLWSPPSYGLYVSLLWKEGFSVCLFVSVAKTWWWLKCLRGRGSISPMTGCLEQKKEGSSALTHRAESPSKDPVSLGREDI